MLNGGVSLASGDGAWRHFARSPAAAHWTARAANSDGTAVLPPPTPARLGFRPVGRRDRQKIPKPQKHQEVTEPLRI